MSADSLASTGDALCAVRGLRVAFPGDEGEVVALEGVDFEIARGERVALVGDSGSGKSTLALALARLLPRHARVTGSIRFAGRDVLALDDESVRALRGASIGMVFQDSKSALHPLMRIADQIAEAWTSHGRASRPAALAQARDALARVGLDPERYARSYPHELSGGMRQRVQIATALALDPPLVVLDEPTTALDTVTQMRTFDLLDSLHAAGRFATLLVTHDLALASSRSDRIVRLERGRIVAQWDPSAGKSVPARRSLEKQAQPESAATPSTFVPRRAEVEPVIETRSLSMAYSVRKGLFSRERGPLVVDGVSIAIRPGEALALVGNSGSGKTSFVRGLLRLVEPVAGAIHYRPPAPQGVVELRALDRERLRAVRPDIGVVFQDPTTSLDPRQTAREVLREALCVRNVRGADAEPEITRLLGDVGLQASHVARHPHQLSGGEAQRLALARALATRPRVLVLDEALASLDLSLRRHVLALLSRLRREQGLACLLVTHDLASVEDFADHVAVMSRGQVVEHGTTASVFRAPVHAATKALLAARPPSVDRDAEIAPQDHA